MGQDPDGRAQQVTELVAEGESPPATTIIPRLLAIVKMKNHVKLVCKALEIIGLVIFLCYLVASITQEVR